MPAFPIPPRPTPVAPSLPKYTDSDIGFAGDLRTKTLSTGRYMGRTYEEASRDRGYIAYLRTNSYRRELKNLVWYHDISNHFDPPGR